MKSFLLKQINTRRRKAAGFTLIELLIVIGILVILMGTVIVAINPMKQFAKANNSQRWANITAILNAVSQNIIDNRGTWTCGAGALPATSTNMADTTSDPAGYDICSCLVPLYIAEMPVDPTAGSYTDCSTYNAGYSIYQNPLTHRVTVKAPSAQSENGDSSEISVTR
jgi:prepilin-type N-terminal cleavage/methylation domain-containing protein